MPDFNKQRIGVDATFRIVRCSRAIYRQFIGRTELVWSRQDLPAGVPQNAFGFYGLRRLSVCAPLVRRRPRRSIRPRARRPSARHRRIDLSDVLAKRVQPDSRTVPAHAATPKASTRTSCCSSSISRLARTARTCSEKEVTDMRVIHSTHASYRRRCMAMAAGRPRRRCASSRPPRISPRSRARSAATKSTVVALAKGYQDPHFVDPKPSFILAVSRADLLIVVGRELEIGWLPPLITSSRNAKIQPGANGYLDASPNVKILEIPTGQITRAMGDVHPQGNPHYWLDPANGRRIARRSATSSVSSRRPTAPTSSSATRTSTSGWPRPRAGGTPRWRRTKARKLVTYHRSWPNFMERFGLNVMGYVEPKPGIPPSTSHTIELIDEMKTQGVKLIVVEPYFDLKTPQAIATQVGGEVLVLAPSVGGTQEATDYIRLFDYDVNPLAAALKRTTGK